MVFYQGSERDFSWLRAHIKAGASGDEGDFSDTD
jgi:hypothetical protein